MLLGVPTDLKPTYSFSDRYNFNYYPLCKKPFPTARSRSKYRTCKSSVFCIQIWALPAMQRVGGRVCDVKGPPSTPLAPPCPAHCVSGNIKSHGHTTLYKNHVEVWLSFSLLAPASTHNRVLSGISTVPQSLHCSLLLICTHSAYSYRLLIV
jgi:hypothetical protein